MRCQKLCDLAAPLVKRPRWPKEWVVKEMLDTGGDVAYAVNVNGSLISPVGGNMGAAPSGVPNGAAVYQVVAPHN